MQKSISEPTTYAKILDGLIDIGFSSALHILHDDGTFNEETYQKYVILLPDFMRSWFAVQKRLGGISKSVTDDQ